MKRFFCILMLASILPLVLACSKNDTTEIKMEFDATILEIESGYIMVEADDEVIFGKYRVNVGEITEYYNASGKEISKDDLKDGDKITVSFNGQETRSLPPQVYGLEIKLR